MTHPEPTPAPPPLPASERFLDGRTALVTGASRGIGRAIALALARRGARLACVASRAENCDAVVEETRRQGGTAAGFGVDVADSKAVSELVERVQAEMGGLYALVNNAGVTRDQLLLRMSDEDFDLVLNVNLKGAFHFTRAAARGLMKNRGRIVNIASVVGLTGNAGQANYAASKAGLIGFTRSIAKELAGRGVCVNAVAPGYVETDMTSSIDAATAEALRQRIPLARAGLPAEIAGAVEYLVGPAGAYVTGQTLVVDGGLCL